MAAQEAGQHAAEHREKNEAHVRQKEPQLLSLNRTQLKQLKQIGNEYPCHLNIYTFYAVFWFVNTYDT